MNSKFLFTLIFTLLFVFNIEAKYVIPERDLMNYNNASNIKKNISYHHGRKLDVYYRRKVCNLKKNKKDVVIHVFGGSFIYGDKMAQTNLGQLLEEEGYIAVVPNYVLFPNGTIEDMVEDVYHAIQWTYKNISKFGGNPNKIYLSTHSSGAHISALTLIKSTLGIKNNGKILKKLPRLEKVILMDGPYIFDQEFLTYTLQGTTNTSNAAVTSDPELQALLQKLMTAYFNDDTISPISILKEKENNSVKFNVGKFIFIYGSDDNVVPESSSKGLIEQITRTSSISIEYIYQEKIGHATIVNGIKSGEEKYKKMYMKFIKA